LANASIVYVFQDVVPSPSVDAIFSVAPHDLVASVFGLGSALEEGSLAAAFGGAAVFRNDQTGESYLGVWGARNCSRFRSMLRKTDVQLKILRQPSPARLVRWMKTGKRAKPNAVES